MPAYVLTVLLTWPERDRHRRHSHCGRAALRRSRRCSAFAAAGTHVEPWKPSSALVTDGIFGWLRNPMYVGLTLCLAGLSIAPGIRLDVGDDVAVRCW